MHINTQKFVDGSPVTVIVRQSTETRLATKCFRGQHLNLAGNFSAWSNCHQLFGDQEIVTELLRDVEEALRENSWSNSVCINLGSCVGWSSTGDRDWYHEEDLEQFEPNRRSHALRVKLDRRDLLAPKTNLLTIVYELKREDVDIVVVVHSIYPGEDVGELRGDITLREGRVFFDWDHPGAL